MLLARSNSSFVSRCVPRRAHVRVHCMNPRNNIKETLTALNKVDIDHLLEKKKKMVAGSYSDEIANYINAENESLADLLISMDLYYGDKTHLGASQRIRLRDMARHIFTTFPDLPDEIVDHITMFLKDRNVL